MLFQKYVDLKPMLFGNAHTIQIHSFRGKALQDMQKYNVKRTCTLLCCLNSSLIL